MSRPIAGGLLEQTIRPSAPATEIPLGPRKTSGEIREELPAGLAGAGERRIRARDDLQKHTGRRDEFILLISAVSCQVAGLLGSSLDALGAVCPDVASAIEHQRNDGEESQHHQTAADTKY